MSGTIHKRFAVALLREALAGAGTLHLDYRVDHEPEVVHGWEPRRSANDPAPHPPLDPDPERRLGQGILGAAMDAAGMVPVSAEIGTEPDFIDMFFEPDPAGVAAPGLLGTMTQKPSILMPFHAPPGEEDGQDAMHLALGLWGMNRRETTKAHAKTKPMPESWLISTEHSEVLISGYGLKPARPQGTYASPPLLALHAVVLAELPRTRATLLLRLLGTGTLLEEALAEQAALPEGALERRAASAALLAVTAEPVPIGEVSKDPVLLACGRAYRKWAKSAGA